MYWDSTEAKKKFRFLHNGFFFCFFFLPACLNAAGFIPNFILFGLEAS